MTHAAVVAAAGVALAGAYLYAGLIVWRARRQFRFLTRQERLRLRAWRTAFFTGTAALMAGLLAAGVSFLLYT